ncbi:unnamed protein product [Caenorhabditis auriculariae]|uniref:Uncharacterized protein n=1 Tax=Caenorhabditis auriculariae TaxID=2777116 RepID=A0A8S1HDH1_9PELO|nr:unnamed protein product [Caenorhabditis auriculariae]
MDGAPESEWRCVFTSSFSGAGNNRLRDSHICTSRQFHVFLEKVGLRGRNSLEEPQQGFSLVCGSVLEANPLRSRHQAELPYEERCRKIENKLERTQEGQKSLDQRLETTALYQNPTATTCFGHAEKEDLLREIGTTLQTLINGHSMTRASLEMLHGRSRPKRGDGKWPSDAAAENSAANQARLIAQQESPNAIRPCAKYETSGRPATIQGRVH